MIDYTTRRPDFKLMLYKYIKYIAYALPRSSVFSNKHNEFHEYVY